MTNRVQHHQGGKEIGKDLAFSQRAFDRYPDNLSRTNLGLGVGRGLKGLGAALHEDAPQATVIRALRFARDCAIGALAIAQAPPGNVTVHLEGRGIPMDRIGPTSQSTTGNWRTAFFASLLLRDEEASEWLATYPLDILQRSATSAAPYAFTMVEALAGFRLDEGGWQQTLRKAIQQAENETDAVEYANSISLPILRMLGAIYADADRFDTLFHDALVAHKSYWSRGTRVNDPKGYIALGPAALAAWASDCNTEIQVDSDYAPRWLVEGEFLGKTG